MTSEEPSIPASDPTGAVAASESFEGFTYDRKGRVLSPHGHSTAEVTWWDRLGLIVGLVMAGAVLNWTFRASWHPALIWASSTLVAMFFIFGGRLLRFVENTNEVREQGFEDLNAYRAAGLRHRQARERTVPALD